MKIHPITPQVVINLTQSQHLTSGNTTKQIAELYQIDSLTQIVTHCMAHMLTQLPQGCCFPYFATLTNPSLDNLNDADNHNHANNLNSLDDLNKLDKQDNPTELWQKPIELDVYLAEVTEAKQLNLEARNKNYATNILSYPSQLPDSILPALPSVPLGELIICHDVVAAQAGEQQKSTQHHLTHLIVHGVLHLLGFDHELGESERIEMEAFEIDILQGLGISNPYETHESD